MIVQQCTEGMTKVSFPVQTEVKTTVNNKKAGLITLQWKMKMQLEKHLNYPYNFFFIAHSI